MGPSSTYVCGAANHNHWQWFHHDLPVGTHWQWFHHDLPVGTHWQGFHHDLPVGIGNINIPFEQQLSNYPK